MVARKNDPSPFIGFENDHQGTRNVNVGTDLAYYVHNISC